MKFTPYEEAMLRGDHGKFKQKAFEKIVDYARALGAEEFCEVSKATLFFGAHGYLDVLDTEDYDTIFSEMYLCSEEKIPLGCFDCHCFSQTDSAPCDQYRYEELHLTKKHFERNRRYLELTKEAGVSIVGSCTPYFNGWIPLKGEHFVTTESSNVLMCNSVFGACGSSDGLEAATWSAICGRAPKWGCHTPEGRIGNAVFHIECPAETATDWDLIGYTIGRMLPPHAIPVLVGNFKNPDIIQLKQCFASMATTSGAEMCHIVGFTPEAPTLDAALGNKEAEYVFTIDNDEFWASYNMVCGAGEEKIDFVTLGCPHYSLQEVRDAALYLKGKKIQKDVELFIWTDYSTKVMADVNGYTTMVEEAGGQLMTSSCPLVIGSDCFRHMRGMVADGAKQAHYIHSESEAPIYYTDMRGCIDAAVAGKWKEDMRYDR